MAELEPVHLMRWIEANRAHFAPPVANKEVFPESEFIYQIVRGPNARNDFHIDPGDEIFFQLQGTPHCPIRPAATWGLVVERKRRPDELDALAWFCEGCGAELYRETFACADIERELGPIIERFNASESRRTCRKCGRVLAVPVGA